jgi:hypothetical protein
MSETEKKDEGQKCCCCCQCFKAIVMAIVLLVIGAAIGHVITMKHCCPMMGPWGGGHSMKACWDRGDREREGGWERKFQGEKEARGEQKGWFEHRADTGKHKPGCTCPMCSQKGAWLPDPNKAGCPMMDKKAGKSKKD